MNNKTVPDQPQPYDMAPDEGFATLVRALRQDDAEDPEPLSCAECRAQLPALYHLQASGEPLPASVAAAHTHLADCPACEAEYAALQDVMGELAAGTLTGTVTGQTAEPTFDLSFLSRPSVPGPALWRRALGESVWQLFTSLQISLHAAGAAFSALPAALTTTPVPASAGVFRSDTPAGRLELLILPAPDAAVSVSLGVVPQVGDYAAVIVKLLAVPGEKPLGDTRVTLRNAQHQLLTGLVTRPDGTAVFDHLPLGRYFVQVRYAQDTWEIPLIIVAGSPPA
jgi:hypothetical protein